MPITPELRSVITAAPSNVLNALHAFGAHKAEVNRLEAELEAASVELHKEWTDLLVSIEATGIDSYPLMEYHEDMPVPVELIDWSVIPDEEPAEGGYHDPEDFAITINGRAHIK